MSRQERVEELYFEYLNQTGEGGTYGARKAYEVAEAEVDNGVLPAYFWRNLQRSRRDRLRRRASARTAFAFFWGFLAGYLIMRGYIADSVISYFWGYVSLLVLVAVLIRRRR